MTTDKHILDIANKTNEFIKNNPDIFPDSWKVTAVVKNYS